MPRIIIYPYNMGSHSARNIQRFIRAHSNFRCVRVRPNGRYRPQRGDFIVNWGCGAPPRWGEAIDRLELFSMNMAQQCHPVMVAGNKLLTFHTLNGAIPRVNIPPYTADRNLAHNWLRNRNPVIVRRTVRGSGGRGVSYHEWNGVNTEPLPEAPLYTQYIKKMAEYRIHVFLDEVIDQQQKKKRRDFDGQVDTRIRSHDRGWIFARDNIRVPEAVRAQAINAVRALGLDFGAVDVIWNNRAERAYVLEVNTAPGLEGRTIESYGRAIIEAVAGAV